VFRYNYSIFLEDLIKKKNTTELIFRFLKGGVSTTFVRHCIMMHKCNIKVTRQECGDDRDLIEVRVSPRLSIMRVYGYPT